VLYCAWGQMPEWCVETLSSVRVILTCSPSGHSEERDEWEEMIPCELHLSVLVATTPIRYHFWPPTDDDPLKYQLCSYSQRIQLPVDSLKKSNASHFRFRWWARARRQKSSSRSRSIFFFHTRLSGICRDFLVTFWLSLNKFSDTNNLAKFNLKGETLAVKRLSFFPDIFGSDFHLMAFSYYVLKFLFSDFPVSYQQIKIFPSLQTKTSHKTLWDVNDVCISHIRENSKVLFWTWGNPTEIYREQTFRSLLDWSRFYFPLSKNLLFENNK